MGPTSAAPVFSYYSNRSSETQNQKKTTAIPTSFELIRHRLIILPSFIAILVIIGCIAYATSLDIQPKIQILSAGDMHLLRDTALYQKGTSEVLKRSIYSRNKLTINTNQVASDIKALYPEFSQVTVVIPLVSRRPIIEVQPADAVVTLAGVGGRFVIDGQGWALISNEVLNDQLKASLPAVIDQSGLEIKEGKQVLPIDSIRFIREVIIQHQAKNISIKEIILPPIANELHVRVTGQDYFVKYNLQGSAREASGTYFAVRDQLSKDGITPTEYIDVRVAEKAFYK